MRVEPIDPDLVRRFPRSAYNDSTAEARQRFGADS